jgi:Transcriptional regulator PadR-like family
MRSPIHWAVLGLLIERPGHGYDLFQRFDSAYAGAIELSSHSQINGALKALEQRGMIERLPAGGASTDARAQPRTRYQPTAKGLRDYWCILQFCARMGVPSHPARSPCRLIGEDGGQRWWLEWVSGSR